jgi:hypothetical protein
MSKKFFDDLTLFLDLRGTRLHVGRVATLERDLAGLPAGHVLVAVSSELQAWVRWIGGGKGRDSTYELFCRTRFAGFWYVDEQALDAWLAGRQ